MEIAIQEIQSIVDGNTKFTLDLLLRMGCTFSRTFTEKLAE